MSAIDEALKSVNKEKIDLIRKNLPSSSRYDSEQMTAEELDRAIIGNSAFLSRSDRATLQEFLHSNEGVRATSCYRRQFAVLCQREKVGCHWRLL